MSPVVVLGAVVGEDGKDGKSAKMARVAERTAWLLLRHGTDGVSFAKVARSSEVSRAWLYKYIGKERQDLIDFMADHLAAELGKLDSRPRTDSREGWVDDSVAGLAGLLESSAAVPWVLPLYFRYLRADNALGQCVERNEARYLVTATHEIATVFGMRAEAARLTAELLLATRLGIAYRHQSDGFEGGGDSRFLLDHYRRWLRALP